MIVPDDMIAAFCVLCGGVVWLPEDDYWESVEGNEDPVFCVSSECRHKALMRGMFTVMRVVRVSLKMKRHGITQ